MAHAADADDSLDLSARLHPADGRLLQLELARRPTLQLLELQAPPYPHACTLRTWHASGPRPPPRRAPPLHILQAPCPHCHHRLPQGNGLGCSGVEALVQALRRPGCAERLHYLGLAANGIGEAGGCSLAGWLGEGGAPLQTIELRDNSLGDRAASALAAMLARNRQRCRRVTVRPQQRSSSAPGPPQCRAWRPWAAWHSQGKPGPPVCSPLEQSLHPTCTPPAPHLHPTCTPPAPHAPRALQAAAPIAAAQRHRGGGRARPGRGAGRQPHPLHARPPPQPDRRPGAAGDICTYTCI